MGLLKYIIACAALGYLHTENQKDQAVRYANSLGPSKLNIGAAGVGQSKIVPLSVLSEGRKCDICPDLSKNIEYCELGKQLPYSDKEFDVIFASHVLEHIKPQQVRYALQEMARIGGEVVVVVPHRLAMPCYAVSSHQSLIYKLDRPYGIHVRNNPFYNSDNYQEYIYLDQNIFKIYQ